MGGGQRDFKAIFAGVAAAGDVTPRIFEIKRRALHEVEQTGGGYRALQHGAGQWALQGHQRHIGQGGDGAFTADARLYPCQVFVFAAGVDDQQVVFAPVDDHQVIQDAAAFCQQQGIALAVQAQIQHINRQDLLQRCGGRGAADADVPHVRDIKQAGFLAGMAVFGHQALRVLHRHAVAGKAHHARAQLFVQGVQGRGDGVGFGQWRTAHKLVLLLCGSNDSRGGMWLLAHAGGLWCESREAVTWGCSAVGNLSKPLLIP